MCRPDLVPAVTMLASRVSKWGQNEDKKLRRLMEYVGSSPELALHGSLSQQDRSSLVIRAYCDADLAGSTDSVRSTSGLWLEVVSADEERTWPLMWWSRKQTWVATSSAEAELQSLVTAVRREGIPMLSLFEHVLGRSVELQCMEDNQAVIAAIKKGYSAPMRHLRRTMRISIAALSELFGFATENTSATDVEGMLLQHASQRQPSDETGESRDSSSSLPRIGEDREGHGHSGALPRSDAGSAAPPRCVLRYCRTECQKADFLTKPLNRPLFEKALGMVGVFRPSIGRAMQPKPPSGEKRGQPAQSASSAAQSTSPAAAAGDKTRPVGACVCVTEISRSRPWSIEDSGEGGVVSFVLTGSAVGPCVSWNLVAPESPLDMHAWRSQFVRRRKQGAHWKADQACAQRAAQRAN